MKAFSNTFIHHWYDFIETFILRDYEYIIKTLEPLLTLSEEMVLLDIGGGTGKILEYFASQVKTPINMDYSREMLTHASSRILKLQADSSFIPLINKCVDKVFLIHVLHHIDTDYHINVLEEIYRILKTRGSCYLFDLYYPSTFLNSLYTRIEEFSVGKTYHIPSESLCSLLRTIGFQNITTTYTDQKRWRYVVFCMKK